MHKEGERTVESAVEARGGFLGRPVLMVLVVSVARLASRWRFPTPDSSQRSRFCAT